MFDFTDALLFGIPVPALILLVIEGLKYVRIIKTSDHSRIANVVLSAGCAIALMYVAKIDEQTMQFVTIIVSGLYNILVSALAYNKTLGSKKDKLLPEVVGAE